MSERSAPFGTPAAPVVVLDFTNSTHTIRIRCFTSFSSLCFSVIYHQTSSSLKRPRKPQQTSRAPRVAILEIARGGGGLRGTPSGDHDRRARRTRSRDNRLSDPTDPSRTSHRCPVIRPPRCLCPPVLVGPNASDPFPHYFANSDFPRRQSSIRAIRGLGPPLPISAPRRLSPVGIQLALSFQVTRSGPIPSSLTTLTALQLNTASPTDGKLSPDSRRFVIGLLSTTGLLPIEAQSRYLVATRNLALIPNLSPSTPRSPPRHGPQGGRTGIQRAPGKAVEHQNAKHARRAIAPHRRFAADSPTPNKPIPSGTSPVVATHPRALSGLRRTAVLP